MSKFLITLFLGWAGVHKFIEKKYGLGILYLFTGGLFGIGWLIDVIVIVFSLIDKKKTTLHFSSYPMHKLLDLFHLDNLEKDYTTTAFCENISPNDSIAYFKNGRIYKTYPPNLDNWYDVKYIKSDGVFYNLEVADSIKQIAIPKFDFTDILDNSGITGSLDYVLRMKAGVFYNRKKKELCSACLWKATELMLVNDACDWQKKDYDRLINWHYELGMYERAEKAKEFLLSYDRYTQNNFDYLSEKIRNSVLQRATEIHHDLVVFDDYGWGCCSKCAKMRGRVYSISGKNKTFPKLPEYALINGNFHPGCRCTMSLYFGDKIFYKGERVDAIKSSNRPWIDDRDEHEIESYNKYLSTLSKEKEKTRNRDEYYEILKKIPDIAPKSFGAYVRMKNSNTAKFKEILKIANENGITISQNTSSLSSQN